jgi:predicted Zn-dependent protease with MMP-like domain
MLDVPPDEFEELVARALDQVPVELADLMDNVVIQIFEESAAGLPVLLGLYEGIPLTERGASYFAALPDRISIYRKPILSICQNLSEVVEQVRITVIHEIAHHFGIDDERLHELGYG